MQKLYPFDWLRLAGACVLITTTGWGAERSATLPLFPGDHIAILGHALPDRMQHYGYFETLVHARFPEHNLVVRNLAAAGDEVDTWFRSSDFGSRDQWLSKVGADVVLAFYGFNEAADGPEGLAEFRSDLEQFLKDVRSQDYSGKGPPRVVLVSPAANEKHQDPNFPDPTEMNAQVAAYTQVMKEVAAANGVPYVNLFEPSRRLYAEAARRGQSLTVNGHYLSEEGDRLLAPILFEGVFGAAAPSGDLEKLRQAVNDKNREWHRRYRTIDGYNVYGGRSALAYQPGESRFISDREAPAPHVSNYHVMQQEMSQRDVLTANRDEKVWAVAQGREFQVDDSNLPPVTSVQSNKPGPKPDRSHQFLSGEEAIARMTVHSGMEVNLYADETQFPELVNPVQMAWDTRGRLWVAAWPNYPERTPTSTQGDQLLIFEDTQGDGKADKMTVFVDDLNAPTGFQFYKDGVLLMQAPDLWFLRDTDGDGRADWKQRVLMGMDSADSHHTANALCLDPGGAIYLSDGVFHRTQVETPWGPVRNIDAAIYRFEPRTAKFERYIAYGFANPHGRVFDRWGNDLVTDATGNHTYFGPAFSGYLDFEKGKHPGMKQFWDRPSRPCPGTGILTSRHFPEEFQGNFLNINVISFQGIYRVGVTEEGAGLEGKTLEHLISSEDPNFRPTAVNIGPDGAIYVADWHNPIIGHMQHHLRDPNRDHQHGRIYRITYKGRPLLKPVRIDGASIEDLLALLKEPENQTRELAKVELGERDTEQVIAAVQSWIQRLDPTHPEYEHQMMEALWVHQWHNVVDRDLLERMLQSPEPRARAAAGRVLCYWRDRVPNSLALFRELAGDAHPRVRLEAVRGASFYRTAEAAEVALAAVNHPMDYYLEYTLKETLRQLEPYWRQAIAEGSPLAEDNPAGVERLMETLSTAELQALPPTPVVLAATLARPELTDEARMLILDSLANARARTKVAVLLAALERKAEGDLSSVAGLARLLPVMAPSELAEAAKRVQSLTGADASPIRQAAWAALAVMDGSFDKVWDHAAKKPGSMADLLHGMPLIPDSEFRSQAYNRVHELLQADAGSTLRRAAIQAMVSMPRDHEHTFATLARLIAHGDETSAAAQGIRSLPRSSWPKREAGTAARDLVAWAKKVPTGERTAQDYVEVVQLATDLASFLPIEQASAVRRDLRDLRVDVFVIRAVREQMRYDTPRLVVETGKTFEIIFENSDFMPHNLAVMPPETREKIGPIVELMKPDQLDRQGRAYMPKGFKIMAATQLLEPGEKATLQITAPPSEGEYVYVCTFPGHWQVMWGQLIVSSDPDRYLQEHPVITTPPPPAHVHSRFE